MYDTTAAYLFRFFWALFLSFMLVFSFRRSWKAERGEKNYLLYGKNDTVILLDPLVLPICIGIYAGICLLLYRWEKSRGILFSLGMDLFFFVTIYFSLLLVLLPFLRKHYTAKTCAAFWLIPVFLFYQPNILYTSCVLPTKAVFYIPRFAVSTLLLIWLAGFAGIFLMQILSHLHFSRMLKKHSQPVDDPELLAIWKHVKQEIRLGDLTIPIKLRYSSLAASPLTVGMFRANCTTYLPRRNFSAEEAELIFSHELHHIQRHDTHTKFFLRFCCAIGWLHPLVWLAVRKAEDDLELSCDEIVLQNADSQKRRQYAELLLSSAGDPRGYTTCLSASAKALRYRLNATLSRQNRKLGLGLLFLAMMAGSFSIGNFALTTERGPLPKVTAIKDIRIQTASFLPEGIQGDGDELSLKDTKALSLYLEQLEAEKFLTLYQEREKPERPALYGVFADEETHFTFYLSGSVMTIYDIIDSNITSSQYYIRSPIDWDYLQTL